MSYPIDSNNSIPNHLSSIHDNEHDNEIQMKLETAYGDCKDKMCEVEDFPEPAKTEAMNSAYQEALQKMSEIGKDPMDLKNFTEYKKMLDNLYAGMTGLTPPDSNINQALQAQAPASVKAPAAKPFGL